MLKIYRPEEAKVTILKRQVLDNTILPQHIQENIRAIFGESLSAAQVVDRILSDVRQRGDLAVLEWTERLDKIRPKSIRIREEDIKTAVGQLSKELKTALGLSIERVRKFHQAQPVVSWFTQNMGGTLGQLIRPIHRVGLYIPAGSAPLPSSLIMSAVPAQVAGVQEIALVVPPQRTAEGINPVILAVAGLLGINEVYTVGGAQAIAALAYGTETIRKVDKIFGPGNLFVTLAKRQVFGVVGIDNLAGPTETMVIADNTANPAWIAADLLAQAEHDPLASAILLSPSMDVIQRVQNEVSVQIDKRSRKEIIMASLQNRSGAVLTEDISEAIDLANEYAPEHLCLSVANPWDWIDQITAAGGVFLGENSFEVLGDYVAGPSHIMPTSGSARFSSPVNVLDFIHIISLVALDDRTTQKISRSAAEIADIEGLDAHANAAIKRLGGEK